jgi:glyoxylase-like metal-dependent hydrolase (beta-lactamase superfamily II)
MSSPPEDRSILVAEKWWSKLPRPSYKNLIRIPTSDEWFEVYLVTRDTYAIYEPGQYEEALCTLVIGSKKAALIDTGCGISDIFKVVDEITDLPVTVVNTHAHNDHIADNHRFKEIWMFDHPWSVEAQKGLPNSEMAHLVANGMVWKPLPKEFDPKKYVVKPFKVTHFYQDGEIIELGSRTLEVIHTPGHTPDSCCLLDRKHRLLFTGDMFYTGGIYTYLNGGDIPTFIQSYKKMLNYYEAFDRLMPSHNEPYVEKELLKDVLNAVENIAKGKGKYVEGKDMGIPIRKYNFGRFSIVARAN